MLASVAKVIGTVAIALILSVAGVFCLYLTLTYQERNEIAIPESIRGEIENMYKEIVDVKANAVGMKKERGTMVAVAVTVHFKAQNGTRAIHTWHMYPINLLEGSLSETSGEEQHANH